MTQASPIDRAELDRLYQRFGASILRRAFRIVGDEQAARDVCHEVFLRVLRAEAWPPASPLGWLYVTTTNLCLNLVRSGHRARLAAAEMPPATDGASPTEARLLLQRVPPEFHELVILWAVDQMSQDEIALVLRVSQKTVSNRLRQLREILDPPETSSKEVLG